MRRPGVAVGAGGLGVSLRVTVTACARGHALPTCPPARQHRPHQLPANRREQHAVRQVQGFAVAAPLLTLFTP